LDNEASNKFSFQLAREIAAAGKSFTEGQFVKKCLLSAASELCPDKKSVSENISLSHMAIQRRVTDISNNLSNQLREKAEEFKYYSLVMDEGTDSTDTAQLLIFVRGTDENFAISEELAGLCSVKGRTTGEEIADEVIKCVIEKSGLTFNNLVAVCTDGAPSMRGNVGAVTLAQKYTGKKITKTHCVIHQQVLCSKVLNFEHVMSVVVSIVNCIRCRGLTHRLFRAFHEVSANYSDLLCHTEVRWLSSGRVLQRFEALRDEIIQLLENYPRKFPELHDEK
jgi:hypothetical protein